MVVLFGMMLSRFWQKKLEDTAKQVAIYIYEPSRNFSTMPTPEAKTSTSALVFNGIKRHFKKKFNSLRLQKAAYFMDLFSFKKKYFRFVPHKYGPYDHSIDIISKGIREFQQFHGNIFYTRSRENSIQ